MIQRKQHRTTLFKEPGRALPFLLDEKEMICTYMMRFSRELFKTQSKTQQKISQYPHSAGHGHKPCPSACCTRRPTSPPQNAWDGTIKDALVSLVSKIPNHIKHSTTSMTLYLFWGCRNHQILPPRDSHRGDIEGICTWLVIKVCPRSCA